MVPGQWDRAQSSEGDQNGSTAKAQVRVFFWVVTSLVISNLSLWAKVKVEPGSEELAIVYAGHR